LQFSNRNPTECDRWPKQTDSNDHIDRWEHLKLSPTMIRRHGKFNFKRELFLPFLFGSSWSIPLNLWIARVHNSSDAANCILYDTFTPIRHKEIDDGLGNSHEIT